MNRDHTIGCPALRNAGPCSCIRSAKDVLFKDRKEDRVVETPRRNKQCFVCGDGLFEGEVNQHSDWVVCVSALEYRLQHAVELEMDRKLALEDLGRSANRLVHILWARTDTPDAARAELKHLKLTLDRISLDKSLKI